MVLDGRKLCVLCCSVVTLINESGGDKMEDDDDINENISGVRPCMIEAVAGGDALQ